MKEKDKNLTVEEAKALKKAKSEKVSNNEIIRK